MINLIKAATYRGCRFYPGLGILGGDFSQAVVIMDVCISVILVTCSIATSDKTEQKKLNQIMSSVGLGEHSTGPSRYLITPTVVFTAI